MGNAFSCCLDFSSETVNEQTPLLNPAVRRRVHTSDYDIPPRFEEKYSLRGVLGTGATGLCHACVERETKKAYACKIVRKKRLLRENKQRVLKQLRMEVKVLKKLRHPNIVEFKDAFESTNNLFILMELIPGGELFAQVVAAGSFSEKQAAGIIRDVAEGLAYCHSMGVIHRDLKPENLLVPGPGLRPVKICDFGLAFVTSKNRQPNTFVGSPRYMAPEQMHRKQYSTKVDIWALGVILFILLSGYLPFEPELLKKGQKARLPIRELALKYEGRRWKNVSWEVKTLIYSCLVIEPDLRLSADLVLKHPWLNGKAPEKLIQSSDHLRRYLLDNQSNGSFFIEPNTLGCTEVDKKLAATHRSRRARPKSINRGWNTPDGSMHEDDQPSEESTPFGSNTSKCSFMTAMAKFGLSPRSLKGRKVAPTAPTTRSNPKPTRGNSSHSWKGEVKLKEAEARETKDQKKFVFGSTGSL